jgi:[ribosomal protein S5]-alanine N-acetyltransferase
VSEPAAPLAGAGRLPTLEGERVRLRWLEPRDVPALLAIFGDADVVRWMSLPLLADEREAAEFLAEVEGLFADRVLFQWGVARREDDRVVGTFTLADLDTRHGTASVGYALAREHWSRGYLREVLPIGLRFAFETLGLRRLSADADPRNAASLRALERAGFRREGYRRGSHLQLGEVQDAVLYGLLREDWEAGAPAVPGPPDAERDGARDMLRHALATLAYRAAKALRDAPEGFADHRVGPTSRTPAEILAHMGDLMDWALTQARGAVAWRDSTPLPWDAECARFFAALGALDDELARGAPLAAPPERLFQGAVADALTHTGQLTMLRRLAGGPVRGESYARAHIAVGRVGPRQEPPVVEFG